jgi:hypothetical protein
LLCGSCSKSTKGSGGGKSIGIAWDASKNPDDTVNSSVTGYRVYYGTDTRDYSNAVDVGLNTQTRLYGLPQTVLYFAVTAYTAAGLESEFSDEVSANVALMRAKDQLNVGLNL